LILNISGNTSTGTVNSVVLGDRQFTLTGVITQRQELLYDWETFAGTPFASLATNNIRFIGCSVGNVNATYTIDITLSGESVTGSISDVVSGQGIFGNTGTGSVGDIFAGTKLEGITATGSVGDVLKFDIAFDLSGVTGTGVVNKTLVRPFWSLINNASNGPPRG